MHANSIFILSHTDFTRTILRGLRGEGPNALKLQKLMQKNGYPVGEVVDIYQIFNDLKLVEKLAFLNAALAEACGELIEEIGLDDAKEVSRKILNMHPELLIILSWNTNIAALYATGIHKKIPTVAKLYVNHENENILTGIYNPSTLLITESLLASAKAIQAGIPPWKIIHLPHHTPEALDAVVRERSWLESKIAVPKETIVLGAISRLEYGKNIEYALQVAKALHDAGENILFVLKGDFEEETPYPVYKEWLKNLLNELKDEKWLFWDREPLPFSEITKVFASLDILLHLSGSEAGSNVTVESLSMGLPTVILDASTNPSLFKGGAIFVKNDGTAPQHIIRPFCVPDILDLQEKVAVLVQNAQHRKEWGEKGKEVAKKRFSRDVTLQRLPLIIKAAKAYHAQSSECDKIQKEVQEQYLEDQRRYAS